MTALLLIGWSLAASAAVLAALTIVASRRERELVARAAHELRGPLTAARLALHSAVLDGAWSRTAAGIDLELRRAGLALADLDAARSGSHAGDREEIVDVEVLLEESLAGWRPVATALGCDLRRVGPLCPMVVRGDRVRLAQALGNLVSNAIEHGGGRIEVRAQATPRAVRIEVTDQGPGLPGPIDLLTANACGGRGDHGRGLAITAEIAARHGGALRSAPSELGARLALELPAR